MKTTFLLSLLAMTFALGACGSYPTNSHTDDQKNETYRAGSYR